MILLALSLAWLAGLTAAALGAPEGAWASAPLALGMTLGFFWQGRPWFAAGSAAGAVLAVAGALAFQAALPPASPGGVALFNDRGEITLHGIVDNDPEERGTSQRFVLRVTEADAGSGWQEAGGRVQVTARAFPEYRYGDILEIRTALETPPVFDGFDYREYLSRQGVVSLAAFPSIQRVGNGAGDPRTAAVIALRDRLGDSLAANLPEPEAALGRGILLGQRAAIPPDLAEDFNRAGISHLVAISGSNVSLVAMLGLLLFTPITGGRWAALAAMLLVVGFVVLVGGSASVARAGFMGCLVLGAGAFGRPASSATALAFAAAVLTMLDQLAILDVAFQLSFAATGGLFLLMPPLSARIQPVFERILPRWLAPVVSVTVSMTTAASIAVFPITAANFERLSLVAIPANIFAVPLFDAVIISSALAAISGLVWAPAGEVTGIVAELPLAGMVWVARAFAALPGARIDIRGLDAALAIALYGLIAIIAAAILRRPMPPSEPLLRGNVSLRFTAVALPAVAAAFVWAQLLLPATGNLRVTVLDVGQGDAILIETPEGRRILVDGGPSGPAVLAELADALPAGPRRIDLVVLTHPQEDHAGGLVAVSERFDVRAAAAPASGSRIGAYTAWLDALSRERTPLRRLTAGDVADLGGGVSIEVLWPSATALTGTEDNLNSNSIVLRLTYDDVSFLLTGDLSAAGEAALMSERGDLRATVLKAGHHGSDGSTTEAFVSAVRPAVAVISAGEGNAFGHPSPTTLLRLAGTPVFRTDRNGSIRFETDGSRLWVMPERGSPQVVPVGAPP